MCYFDITGVYIVLKNQNLLHNIGVQVVIAMIIGTIVGIIMGHDAVMFAPLGSLFIHLIKMLVIPLVAVAIISGAASLGNSHAAGKIGITTLAFFGITSALAVALALVMGVVFQPGIGVDLSGVAGMFANTYADKGTLPSFWATILGMIPPIFLIPLMKLISFKFSSFVYFLVLRFLN